MHYHSYAKRQIESEFNDCTTLLPSSVPLNFQFKTCSCRHEAERDEIIIIWIELSPKMHFQSRNLFSRASKEWKKIFLKYFRWNIFWLLVGNPCLFEKGHLEIWGLTLYKIVRTRKSGLSMTTYGKYSRIEFSGDW